MARNLLPNRRERDTSGSFRRWMLEWHATVDGIKIESKAESEAESDAESEAESEVESKVGQKKKLKAESKAMPDIALIECQDLRNSSLR